MKASFLFIDDEKQLRLSCLKILQMAGMGRGIGAEDGPEGIELLYKNSFSGVFLDLHMPQMDGEKVLREITHKWPDLPVVILTAFYDAETVLRCMNVGAYDFLVKPVDRTTLLGSAKRMAELTNIRAENRRMQNSLAGKGLLHPENFEKISTKDPQFLSTLRYLESLASTNLPVLITGETGTGKELAAQAVHDASGRKGLFVAENIAGVESTLLSDALFGHKKGAFTGAHSDAAGLIEQAAEGTLFLDEIGDLDLKVQSKLLRLLQEGEWKAVGDQKKRKVRCRFLFATHCDLEAMVRAGTFRQDLFYRIQSHKVRLPSLRERPVDIPLLTRKFIREACGQFHKAIPAIPPELDTLLLSYEFPGNVRELQGMIVDSIGRCLSGHLSFGSLIASMNSSPTETSSASLSEFLNKMKKLPTLKDSETLLVEEALQRCEGNKTQAARLLGLKREALSKRLHRCK